MVLVSNVLLLLLRQVRPPLEHLLGLEPAWHVDEEFRIAEDVGALHRVEQIGPAVHRRRALRRARERRRRIEAFGVRQCDGEAAERRRLREGVAPSQAATVGW